MQLKSIINYTNKIILAPMVRGSLLPLRLLALRYGADLVYTDEIVDHSMLSTTRKPNDMLGTVDFVNEGNAFVVFRTSSIEREKLVFQIGTSDVYRAIKVAKIVENDVSAIDINMGCPKSYSTSSGMGAALLSDVDNAKRIVQGLVENIQLPITCKIRISNEIDKTIDMVRDFERLGVSAVAVHGRTREQRPRDPVDENAIRRIAESVKIPIIANGGSLKMKSYDDMLRFKEDCGASSVMVARAAQENVSIFRKEGRLVPVHDLITEYLKLCIEFDHSWSNAIYSVNHMLQNSPKSIVGFKGYKELQKTTSLEEICDYWNLGDYCRDKKSEYKTKGIISLHKNSNTSTELLKSREETFNERNIITEWMQYRRKCFDATRNPKLIIKEYCDTKKIPLPTYATNIMDSQFNSIITFEGKQYATVICHRSKTIAEQAAALVCAFHLGLFEENFLLSIGCLINRC